MNPDFFFKFGSIQIKRILSLNVSVLLELQLSSGYKKQCGIGQQIDGLFIKAAMVFYGKRSERDILANESESDMWSLLPDYYSICSALT